MFDDKPTNQNQTPASPASRLGGPNRSEPNNLSSGPAMASLPKPPMPPRPTPPAPEPLLSNFGSEPEDILDNVDTTAPQIKGPASAMTTPGTPVPPAVSPAEKPETREPFIKQYKKVLIAVILVLVIGGVAIAAGWYGYQTFFPSATSQPAASQLNLNQPSSVTNTNLTNQEPADQNIGEQVGQPAIDTNQPPPPLDTDRDGLTDEEEALYGTNLNAVDSDNDGLTERDEAKVFKTDPNNPDTDGDTYPDGTEVRSGFDPKGSGRLLQIK